MAERCITYGRLPARVIPLPHTKRERLDTTNHLREHSLCCLRCTVPGNRTDKHTVSVGGTARLFVSRCADDHAGCGHKGFIYGQALNKFGRCNVENFEITVKSKGNVKIRQDIGRGARPRHNRRIVPAFKRESSYNPWN